jgi:hypothetical protein
MGKIHFIIKVFTVINALLTALNEWAKKVKRDREKRNLESAELEADKLGRPTPTLNSVYDDSAGVQSKPTGEGDSE